jgi:RNA polymerase sigma-70 factor (ECF subfamily)
VIASEETLRTLMTKSQTGDRQCYASLLAECEKWLRRYFAKKIAPQAIDDLVQETLISLHRKRASYAPDRPFLPWLAAIARYRWVDQLRSTYRHAHDELFDTMAVEPQSEDIEARVSIETLLGKLPPAQSEVIRIVKIEGLSIAEAAGKTGQSESLVKVNIHRGLKKLTAIIDKS